MSAPTTLVAIDFDGVVNALPRTDDDLAHFTRWDQQRVLGYVLTVAGEVLDWLASLPDRGGQFHWATTWTPNRHLLQEAFGLPAQAPVAADPDAPVPSAPAGVSWKGAQIAAKLAADPRPLAWLDDDAITAPTAAYLDDLADRLDVPMLGLTTSLRTGLRPADMARVDEFLAAVQAGTAPTGLQAHRTR